MLDWVGLEFWNSEDVRKLALRMALDLVFVFMPIRVVYLRLHGRHEFALSCILLNVMTFAVCVLLRKVPVEIGFALGLFGVFGILRFRTEAVSVRSLSYLFVANGIGVLNVVANKKVSLTEILFINSEIHCADDLLGLRAAFRAPRDKNGAVRQSRLLAPERNAELATELGGKPASECGV
jgi:hypothetical protein